MKVKGACDEAARWLESQPDAQTAWRNCEKSQWMLWWLNKCGIDNRTKRRLAVRFARRVQHLMRDERSIAALDVAERHADGLATDEELAAAWAAASDAARAASAAAMAAGAAAMAAGDAAIAAAGAAAMAAGDAAIAAACAAASAAAMAAGAAAMAAYAYAYAAERLAQCGIIRELIPQVPQNKESTT